MWAIYVDYFAKENKKKKHSYVFETRGSASRFARLISIFPLLDTKLVKNEACYIVKVWHVGPKS
jgi:hypothetical protein